MKVLIFGAAGKTGSLVVQKALAARHEVSVFVREGFHGANADIHVITGDAENEGEVRGALQGQEAVIDTIGGDAPYKSTELESKAAHNIIGAMQAEGAKRLVVVSMMGVGDSKQQAPFWYEHILLPLFLSGADKDKTAMEAEVKASGLEFVIARPPLLLDEPATQQVKVLKVAEKGHKITREDLAQFLVDQLGKTEWLGQAVTVVNS